MKEFKLYTVSEREIIDAFAKEGIEISFVDCDKGIVYPELKTETDVLLWDKKDEEFCDGKKYFLMDYIMCKHLLNIEPRECYIFAPDGDQSLPGLFNIVPLE